MERGKTGDLKAIKLPRPVFERSATVFETLKARGTTRTISDKAMPLQLLSDVLWAAQGVNRKREPFGGPGRTSGSASNAQEISVYVAMEEGTYLYEPDSHTLAPVASGDLRAMAIGPGQGGGAGAPARLIYVADLEKLANAPFQEPGLHRPETQKSYYFVDTGLIAQNVYLACSALGLASWFHNCDRAGVKKRLSLGPNKRALFGQTIGYAEK